MTLLIVDKVAGLHLFTNSYINIKMN